MNRELRRRKWMAKMRKELAQDPNAHLEIPRDLFEPEEIEGILLDMGYRRVPNG